MQNGQMTFANRIEIFSNGAPANFLIFLKKATMAMEGKKLAGSMIIILVMSYRTLIVISSVIIRPFTM